MASSNPYIGPRSFNQNESLYGRDRELRQLTDRLIAERIVLLHSPSGAGKTSLIQAGLIPKLQEEGFFVHPVIRVNRQPAPEEFQGSPSSPDLRPPNRYVFSTLLSLEERYPVKERMKPARLARLSLQNYLTYRSLENQQEGPELLVFDQFEEILTLDSIDREAKKAFFSHLSAVLKNRNRWALFSLRTDYVGALEPYVRSVPTYFTNTYHLDLLNVKAALEAIQKPAQAQGVEFTAAAAQKLVDDLRRVHIQGLDGSVGTQLGPQVEPVQLQVVCYRIWEGKTDGDAVIDETDLENIGDVNQSLAEYYAASVARVAEVTQVSERGIREWFSRKLITSDGVRSQARLGAEACEGLPIETVRRLEDTHLVRQDQRAGQIWFELAHDRLIGPVQTSNQKWFETHLSLFQRQAVLWAGQGFSDGLLLRGKELETAEAEARSLRLTPDEKAFLEAGLEQRKLEQRDKRQRQFILAGFILSLFFLALAVAGFFTADTQRRSAQAASTQAIAEQATSQTSLRQQATSEAARFSAVAEQATAVAQQATAMADQATAVAAAATAQFDAGKQTLLAQANNLTTRSILLKQTNGPLSALLALEAFRVADIPSTRLQLLTHVRQLGLPSGFGQEATTTYLSFSPDQSYLIQGSFATYSRHDTKTNFGGIIRARDAKTGKQLGENFGLAGLLDAVVFSPDGAVVASASCIPGGASGHSCQTERLILWDAQTHLALKKLTLAETFSYSPGQVLLAFSPDGSFLAAEVNGSPVQLWDLQTCLKTEAAPCTPVVIPVTDPPVRLAFTPDSRLLALLTNQKISFLSPATGAINHEIPAANPVKLVSLAFSPDGQVLAAGNLEGEIFLWNWQTSALTGRSLSYVGRSDVLSLAFNPGGDLLAAGYSDFALILWDLTTHEKLVPVIFKHRGPVLTLAFSGDGKKLASGGDAIYLWDLDPASWVAKVCDAAGRNFTEAEWTQYFPGRPYEKSCPNY
jgi:WD40 repeat protein